MMCGTAKGLGGGLSVNAKGAKDMSCCRFGWKMITHTLNTACASVGWNIHVLLSSEVVNTLYAEKSHV
jgi:hypothetical protein